MFDRIGHLCLLFFIYTTYLPAPVFGFGWLLSILGFALALLLVVASAVAAPPGDSAGRGGSPSDR